MHSERLIMCADGLLVRAKVLGMRTDGVREPSLTMSEHVCWRERRNIHCEAEGYSMDNAIIPIAHI